MIKIPSFSISASTRIKYLRYVVHIYYSLPVRGFVYGVCGEGGGAHLSSHFLRIPYLSLSLCLCLCVCVSLSLCVSLSVCLCLCLCLSLSLSLPRQSFSLQISVCLSVFPTLSVSVYLSLSVSLSLSLCLCLCLSVCLSLFVSTSVCLFVSTSPHSYALFISLVDSQISSGTPISPPPHHHLPRRLQTHYLRAFLSLPVRALRE